MASWNHSHHRNWEELLHAYVDDMLPPRQRLEVEEYLHNHPEEARRVADFRAQNRLFHELYDQHLSEPLPGPTRLLEERLAVRLARRWTIGGFARAAATVAIAVLAAGGGWYGARYHFTAQGPEIDFSALSGGAAERSDPVARPGTRERDIRSANAAADHGESDRGSAPSRIPNLSRFGFQLTGSRQISHSDGSQAVQLTYESEKNRQVTLYFSPTDDDSRKIRFSQQGPVAILVWNRDGRSYSLIGEIERDRMLAIGAAINAPWVRSPAQSQGNEPETSPPENRSGAESSEAPQKSDAATDGSVGNPVRPAASRKQAPSP